MTPDEIATHIPYLTLGDVHAALSYYFDHVNEIQEEIRVEREYAEEMRRKHPSLLEKRMRERRLERPA